MLTIIRIQTATQLSALKRKSSTTSAEYCLNSVKNHDYENFATTILLKGTARSCGFAVRSFNVEIARIAEQVSQKEIGLLRIKFWEDAVDKCFTKKLVNVPQHPVALELFKAITASNLTKRYLNNLIMCRKNNLNITSFHSLEEMENYCEQAVSSVFYLILESLGVRNVHADHAASHLGKAQGIVQHLRSVPHSKKINFIPIPHDVLVKHNVSQEEVLRQRASKKLNDCVYEVASRAHQHLIKSRGMSQNVPRNGRSALLPAVATSLYLDRLQKMDYDVYHPSLRHRPWNMLPRIWFTNFRNKY